MQCIGGGGGDEVVGDNFSISELHFGEMFE